jgi:hypothetical protein
VDGEMKGDDKPGVFSTWADALCWVVIVLDKARWGILREHHLDVKSANRKLD